MNYAWKSFKLASDFIKKGASDKGELLHDLYCYQLIMVLHHLLPTDCQDDFAKIQSYVTLPEGVEAIGGHSGASYKIAMLPTEEIEDCFNLINRIFEKLDMAEQNV